MHKYRLVAKKGEGTFSEVLKAQCIKNGKYVAIKCMKNHFDSSEQVNNLREIQALKRLSPHAHIVKLLEVLFDQPTGRLALVFELMDMNIYELIRGRRHYIAEQRLRGYMYQLIKAMDHMHRNGIFHRDIKPENILIMDDYLKLADFGSCRGIYSKPPYTEYISTRWYRAPECLLTDGYYNYKMDMWGVGCVFFEIISLFPLFPGTSELDQIAKIHDIIGTPPPQLLTKFQKRASHFNLNFPQQEGSGIDRLLPHASPDCVDLIKKLLVYNPDERLSARQALKHPFFQDIREAERIKAFSKQSEQLGVRMSRSHLQGELSAGSLAGRGLAREPSGSSLQPEDSFMSRKEQSHLGRERSMNLGKESSLPHLEKLEAGFEARLPGDSSATHLPGLALAGQHLGRDGDGTDIVREASGQLPPLVKVDKSSLKGALGLPRKPDAGKGDRKVGRSGKLGGIGAKGLAVGTAVVQSLSPQRARPVAAVSSVKGKPRGKQYSSPYSQRRMQV